MTPSRPLLVAFALVLVGGSSLVAGCSGDSSSDGPMGDDDSGAATGDDAGGGGGGGGGGGDDAGGGGDDAGGGGLDSGPGDDGGGDAGTGCGTLTFCDGFEDYSGAVTNGMMLGPWKASVAAGMTMTVDGTKAYRGAKSLHLTMGTGAGTHGTLNQKVAAGLVKGNNLFGRAMVYYSNTGGNGLPVGVHSWLFNASGNSQASGGNVTLNMGGGGAKMQLNYHPASPPAPAGTESSVQGGAMTAGAWHCVQWEYDGSGTPVADHAKVWVDGKSAVDVPKAKGWDLATPWSSMDFGFTHYQTLANGVDVYLDEFAVDDTMVACP